MERFFRGQLYVPSIGLIVAGDVVYNQCRIYVGDTTPESRRNWMAALDRLAALNPAIVVGGHKKPGALDSPSAIQDTKHYLLDFDRLQQTTASDEELFNQMTELYPHWVANQSWLMFGFPSGKPADWRIPARESNEVTAPSRNCRSRLGLPLKNGWHPQGASSDVRNLQRAKKVVKVNSRKLKAGVQTSALKRDSVKGVNTSLKVLQRTNLMSEDRSLGRFNSGASRHGDRICVRINCCW